MRLRCYRTLWGFSGTAAEAAQQAREDGYDGLEGPVPLQPAAQAALRDALAAHGLDQIAEICTAGSYVPDRHVSVAEHLDSLQRQLDAAVALGVRRITVLAGCDAWPVAQSVAFFGRAQELAEATGLPVSFETHRGRSLFNPWVARDIALALPSLTFTADFSHWCVVCERLIDSEEEVLAIITPRVRHIHARVGYDQGPQVPHPAAPEYAAALAAHQRWWERCWAGMRNAGLTDCTLTPEFGPDGYLQQQPFTGTPVADLRELNRWMLHAERAHFARWLQDSAG